MGDREWTWTFGQCQVWTQKLKKTVAWISSEWLKASPKFLHQLHPPLNSPSQSQNAAKIWTCHKPPSEIGYAGLYNWRCSPGLAPLTAVAALPAYVKGACRATAFLRNFCQVSCLQGQKEQVRWDEPEVGAEVTEDHRRAFGERSSWVLSEQSESAWWDYRKHCTWWCTTNTYFTGSPERTPDQIDSLEHKRFLQYKVKWKLRNKGLC